MQKLSNDLCSKDKNRKKVILDAQSVQLFILDFGNWEMYIHGFSNSNKKMTPKKLGAII
jgi:hypothetical protein